MFTMQYVVARFGRKVGVEIGCFYLTVATNVLALVC